MTTPEVDINNPVDMINKSRVKPEQTIMSVPGFAP